VSQAASVVPREGALLPPGHPWTRLPAVGLALGVLGLALVAVPAREDPQRALAAWLVAFVTFLTLALGCLYFVLIHTAMQGAWGVVVRRVAENAAGTLPLFALLFLPLALGMEHLYPWSRPEAAADALLRWKRPYLNEGFFLLRAVLYFVVWSAIALWFLRQSRRQDEAPSAGIAARLVRWSAPLLIPLGLTHTFAAMDWLMSLEPHWYSTIYGVYSFSGSLVAAFAFLSIATVTLRREGPVASAFSAEHLHDLGKLLFAFTVFWAYIGFSQYFLIWYGNLPEETVFFRLRLAGGWASATLLLAVGHFAVPFLLLLSRRTKRSPLALSAASLWLLLMHLLDVYWLVIPALHLKAAGPGLADVGALLAVGGAFAGTFGWLTRRHAVVPLGDPRLAESMAFENV
jgi:hypothetical protein